MLWRCHVNRPVPATTAVRSIDHLVAVQFSTRALPHSIYHIPNWTLDEIRRLVTDMKSELLNPAVHTFDVLDIYTARKHIPSSMCASVESN